MGNTESPESRSPRPAGIPRWLALALAPVVWLVVIPASLAGVPWALSHLGPRYGWSDGGPSGWNLLGLGLIGFGAALLVWVMVHGFVHGFSRYRDLPERLPIDRSPVILVTGGPYAFSRNPMYIGALAVWLGLAVLFGSPAVLVWFVAWFAVLPRLVVREEEALEAAFGDAYRRYEARVPRWVGVPRRKPAAAEPGVAADRPSAGR